MFARIVECISAVGKKEELPKQLHPATRTQPVAAGSDMIHDQAMLKWARELAFVLFLVLIALVISIAGK